MREHLEITFTVIGGIGGLLALFGKYLARLLTKKREEVELEFRVKSLEETRKEDRPKLEKIAILEEKIKHLE